ncbi:hypothetical protein [Lichenifustis flavocetrariae]|nr:hypothetical protein [Lichenifustis flavocetrariae]
MPSTDRDPLLAQEIAQHPASRKEKAEDLKAQVTLTEGAAP